MDSRAPRASSRRPATIRPGLTPPEMISMAFLIASSSSARSFWRSSKSELFCSQPATVSSRYLGWESWLGVRVSKISKFCKILQIFSGLVLGCIKTKFCKKICVRQHFSSSTRFASFCTAAISKFYQKIGLKNEQFS